MIEKVDNPGYEKYSVARKFGSLIRERMEKDKHFYIFSPDETTSNKLDEVYEVSERAWNGVRKEFDLPESKDGRIVELLSENVLFGTMMGHIMNGEQAVMTSYEAFFSIVFSQILQQIKFFKQCEKVDFRPKYPAVNLLSTSTCFRQDHNGFTHQSPALISALLEVPSNRVNCLFPVDDVACEECFNFMMKSENVVNFTTFDKNEEPRWIDSYHAKFLFSNGGASIYRFVSQEEPDVVLTACGDSVTRETIRGMEIFKKDEPSARLRFVGINALSYRAIGTTENKLSQDEFLNLFTSDKPIISNFHGYPQTLRNIIREYTDRNVVSLGFIEEGSTTTPFEMLTKNYASRLDVAIRLAEIYHRDDLIKKYQKEIEDNHNYAVSSGIDKIML